MTSWCEEYDGQAAADAFVVHHARLVAAEAREFVFYAHWADLHAPDTEGSSGGRVLPGAERVKTLGGDGTPQVWEFAAAELAPLAGVGITSIEHTMRDALDARHRHPQLWRRTKTAAACDAPDADPALAASMVRVWQVRKIVAACHRAGLTLAQARWVDAVTTPRLGRCGFAQFLTELEAAIIEVDPAAAAQREQAEAMRRYVTKGQANEHGLATLVAKVEAGDAVAFLAMVNLLADALAADGDTSPADVRRSKAVGLLAHPAAALTFLIAHGYGQLGDQDGDEPGPGQPVTDEAARGGADGDPGAKADADTADTADTADDADTADAGDHDSGHRGPGGANSGEGQGVLDLFADRRVRGVEGTQPAGGADFHHPRPPDQPDPGEPPGAPPPAPADLRVGDLHPAFDDSADHDPTQPREDSAPVPSSGSGLLSRAAVLVHRLAACGILDKVTTIDPAKLRPRAVLYVHVHESSFTRDATGVARLEDGHGPTTAQRAYQLLGHHHVDVRRVIDLADQRAAEAHEVPAALREALHLLRPASVFPYAAHHGETKDTRDADHTTPWTPTPAANDGKDSTEPPQTRLDNLGFLTRRQHRVKTFARGWIHHQPTLGVHLWRTRYGYWYRVDHTGTHPLGKHTTGVADTELLHTQPPPRPGDAAADIRRVLTVLRAIDPISESPLEHRLADLVDQHQPA
jgi:hypothetical protein